jgi:hypothetical protein
LYAAHLCIAAVVLAMPYLPRLFALTILNRPTTPVTLWRPYGRRWQNWSLVGLKTVAVALILGMGCYGSYHSWQRYLSPPPEPPLTGLYKVQSIALDGKSGGELPDAQRWRRFSFTKWGMVVVESYADKREYMRCKVDEQAGTITLTVQGRVAPVTLMYTKTDDGLSLEGPFNDSDLKLSLTKVDDSAFPLKSRGFNWIQEMPVNW